MEQMIQQLITTWSGWSWPRRISMISGLLVSFAAIGILVDWTTEPNYTPLMNGLTPQDAAEIREFLKSEGVSFQLSAGGTTVEVPESELHGLRLSLAAEGLPRGGGVGFEVVEQQSMGTSRFAERLNYVRGLQGELQRTIRSMEPIQDVRVHIVMPERRIFRSMDELASASVTVQLYRGRTLVKNQVQAIVHLVSSSVTGLSPEAVTVVDAKGSVLAKGGKSEPGVGDMLEQQRAIESSLESRVVEILERVVGSGNASVKINATLDHTRVERTTERFDPNETVLRSELTQDEQRGANDAGARGIPGTRTNLAGSTANTAATANQNSSTKRSQTRNFEISKIVSHEKTPNVRLARLSVAVLVNGLADKKASSADADEEGEGEDGEEDEEDAGEEEEVADEEDTQGEEAVATAGADSDIAEAFARAGMKPRSDKEIERLETLVKNAIGFDENRGDSVQVLSMPFIEAEFEPFEEAVTPYWLQLVQELWKPVVAVMLLFIVGRVLLRRGPVEETKLLERPKSVREMERELAAGRGGEQMFATPEEMMNLPPPDPERAASVLKNWIRETT